MSLPLLPLLPLLVCPHRTEPVLAEYFSMCNDEESTDRRPSRTNTTINTLTPHVDRDWLRCRMSPKNDCPTVPRPTLFPSHSSASSPFPSFLIHPLPILHHIINMTTTTAKTAISAKDAKILDMVFNPEGTMLPDKETETMLNTEPTGKQERRNAEQRSLFIFSFLVVLV